MATPNNSAGKTTKPAEPKQEAAAVTAPGATLARDAAVAAPSPVAPAAPPAAAPSAAAAPVAAASPATVPVAAAAPAPKPAVATPAPAPLAAVAVQSTSVAVVEPVKSVESEEFAAAFSFDFDAALWSKKSFELWAENAVAFLDLADKVGKAKTFDEVASLQSRFAGERFDAFIRQSKEVMALAQKLANLTMAPLRGARAA